MMRGSAAEPPFEPRVALASLSGESDATWARDGAPHAGVAFLGGIALDEKAREAARQMVGRDRNEFLPPDPVAFVDEEFSQLADVRIRPGINVRTTALEPLVGLTEVCRRHDALVEINAHCRQEEMCAVGGGESLLKDAEKLCEQVRTVAREDVDVSVKVRAEVPGVDLPALCSRLERAGAGVVHVDAMDSESVVADVVQHTELTVIANNGVRNRETVFEYLEYGADAVSVGRPSDDLRVLSRVREATEEWFSQRERAQKR